MLLAHVLYPHLEAPEHCVTASTLVMPLIMSMSCYLICCKLVMTIMHIICSQVDHEDVVDIKNWVTRCVRHQELGYKM